MTIKQVRQLSIEELEGILMQKAFYVDWFNTVESAVFKAAQQGKTKKFKIVNGRSFRQWNSPVAAKAFFSQFEIPREDWEIRKMISPAQALKVSSANKKDLSKALEEVTTKPPGKLTLVPMDDKRQAVTMGDYGDYFDETEDM
jgi:hypothetical protein